VSLGDGDGCRQMDNAQLEMFKPTGFGMRIVNIDRSMICAGR